MFQGGNSIKTYLEPIMLISCISICYLIIGMTIPIVGFLFNFLFLFVLSYVWLYEFNKDKKDGSIVQGTYNFIFGVLFIIFLIIFQIYFAIKVFSNK
jgi:hypothetical protein